MEATKLSESKLARHLKTLLLQIGLTLIDREVVIGAFRLDAIANDCNGALVIVEIKTAASKDTLGQLLIYPHALSKALKGKGIENQIIRSVLITTYLDRNVIELVACISAPHAISLYVCTGSEPALTLVSPEQAPAQVWDQSTVKNEARLQRVCQHLSSVLAQ